MIIFTDFSILQINIQIFTFFLFSYPYYIGTLLSMKQNSYSSNLQLSSVKQYDILFSSLGEKGLDLDYIMK